MLEKIPGCQLISRLWSILLMEADFNCINKILFCYRLLWNVHQYGFMPDAGVGDAIVFGKVHVHSLPKS
jgi:hypothetical protein